MFQTRHFRGPLLSDERLVELTAAIALENLHARFNYAFKVESAGLCTLPAEHPVRKALGRIVKCCEREAAVL